MQVQTQPIHQSWISYAITIGIIVVIMALRMRRMGQMRPLNLNSLWIVPAPIWSSRLLCSSNSLRPDG